ncbi:hypothetical protein RCL_jg637.t2 [Rhizophagus clarus]|uniref:Uncharacterized protein n=1 Tax=Rhizophagus clarus TaxID=94130 RepID=A0A8H3LQA9_9GLOM|nr:hypothetical protein RCL_jg637.t2 [Rhizophagus clarus]
MEKENAELVLYTKIRNQNANYNQTIGSIIPKIAIGPIGHIIIIHGKEITERSKLRWYSHLRPAPDQKENNLVGPCSKTPKTIFTYEIILMPTKRDDIEKELAEASV